MKGKGNYLFLFGNHFPGRKQPKQKCQDTKRQNKPESSHQGSVETNKAHLETCETRKTFWEKLAADYYIPSHWIDANKDHYASNKIECFAKADIVFIELKKGKDAEWDKSPNKPLRYK